MTTWRHPHYPFPALKPASEKDQMRARFANVIRLAGYSERAVESILEEWFEKYYNDPEDKDHSKFIAMFERYEEDYKRDGEII